MQRPEFGESKFEKPHLTLDLADLSDAQRREGSVFMGGSAAQFITSEETFDYAQVETIVFNWGDPRVLDEIAKLFEHQEDPELPFLPFVPVAVVNDEVWLLTLQDREWDPSTAYQSAEDYIEIPFDTVEGQAALTEFIGSIPTFKQAIGKLGNRYVLFGMSTNLTPEKTGDTELDFVVPPALPEKQEESVESMVERIEAFLTDHDFANNPPEKNRGLTFHIAHWLLETYGQQRKGGEWVLWSDDEGTLGNALPIGLRHLFQYAYRDELFLQNENAITMVSGYNQQYTEAMIPRYDEVLLLSTFQEQLDFIKSNPDILSGLQPGRAEVWPEVKITLQPRYYKWGLEFRTSQLGTKVLPFGAAGETEVATNYVLATPADSAELAETICQLVIAGVRHSDHQKYARAPDGGINTLIQRLTGRASIPLPPGLAIPPPPSDAVKHLLITKALEIPPPEA